MAYRDTIQAETGLLNYWPLDDVRGATSFAALAGGVALTPGSGTGAPLAGVLGLIDGTAVSFAGDDFAQTASAIDLSGQSKVIVECLLWKPVPYTNSDAIVYELGASTDANTTGLYLSADGSPSGGSIALWHKGDTGYSEASYAGPSLGRWRHLVAVFDKTQATNEISLYIDGVLVTPGARAFNTNNTNAFANAVFYLFSRAGASRFGRGKMQHLAIYGASANAATIAGHYASLPAQPSSYVFVADGDSLSTDFTRVGTATMPQLLSGLFVAASQINYAVAGQRIDQAAADAATQIDTTFAGLSDFTQRILVFLCGINDISIGDTAAFVLGELQSYHAARKSAGWKTVLFTLTKSTGITGSNETQRQALNTSLRADHSFADYFVDLDADSRFSDPSDTTYFTDGVHYTVAGASAAADLIHAAVSPSTSGGRGRAARIAALIAADVI